ncbi:MAG: sigma-70 family RNA polymerase sigma factor [Bacteroidaceae bacterium]|nr:sigma-70 family RNA polymerase sigma factor [Bacteroidaceae bacterium]
MHTYHLEADDVLVRLYEEGNDAAFDVLLERHQQRVFNYILGLIHNEDEANDLFQEVFVKAITRIRSHRYVESGRFGSWLMRIAHNLVIDSFRQGRGVVTVSGDTPEGAGLLNKARLMDHSVDQMMATEQTFADLEALMQRLPKPQQEIVQMRMFQGMSFKEIAAQCNCSINTALGRMRYAILNLRKMAASYDLTIAE